MNDSFLNLLGTGNFVAAFKALRQNGRAAAELFKEFPEFARAAENVAGQLANGGLKLSDETVEKLAAAITSSRSVRGENI